MTKEEVVDLDLVGKSKEIGWLTCVDGKGIFNFSR